MIDCPVCGQYKFESSNNFEVCPVCGWENDAVQNNDPDYRGGANTKSLNEYRGWWQSVGMKGRQKDMLFYQFAFPMPVVNPNPRLNNHVFGFANGVLFDGAPFVAELWHDETDRLITILLPYQNNLAKEIDEWPLVAKDSNVIGYHNQVESEYYTEMTDGMVVLHENLDFPASIAYIDYLKNMGLIKYLGKMENGSVSILSDYANNHVACIRINLTVDGEDVATTPIRFKPLKK